MVEMKMVRAVEFKRRKLDCTPIYAEKLLDSPFSKLSEELVRHIFQYVSIEDLNNLCLTCKSMSTLLIDEIMSNRYVTRILNSFIVNCPVTESIQIGILAKRTSFLYPIESRLKFLCYLIHQIEKGFVKNEMVPGIGVMNCFGIMIRVFLSGWEDTECIKALSYFCKQWLIYESLNCFFKNALPALKQARHNAVLKKKLRELFFDHWADDRDKATILLFFYIKVPSATLFGQLLLLLSCPNVLGGYVDMRFPSRGIRPFELHCKPYISLAKNLALLRLIPKWSLERSLDLIRRIIKFPKSGWLIQSMACLFVPLCCVDMDSVVHYVAALYLNGHGVIASLLMTEIVMLFPRFSSLPESKTEEIVLDDVALKKLIFSVITHPLLFNQRCTIIRCMYGSIYKKIRRKTERAIQDDDHDVESVRDFQDLTHGLKLLSVFMTSD